MELYFYISILVALELSVLKNISCQKPRYEYTHHIQNGQGDLGCELDKESEKLQVAFVIDITHTNINNVKIFAEKSREVLDALNALHPDTEFALTTHASWEESAFKHSDPEGCYNVLVNFTTDSNRIVEAVSKIKKVLGSPDIEEENSFSAMAFTISDLSIGWIKGDKDKKGRNVHKIVFLFTDRYSLFELPNPGNRKPFRGDGTDTCTTSLPVSKEHLARMMHERNIKYIGTYIKIKDPAYDQYNQFFSDNNIRHTSGRFENANELNFHFPHFCQHKVMEHLACYFDDPIGYNSLGL